MTPAQTAAPRRKQPGATAPGGERVDLSITGMTCAACVRRVEQSLSRSPGVVSAAVNLATARATVEYDPAATNIPQLVRAVEATGYGASGIARSVEEADRARAEEYLQLRRRFAVAATLSVPLLVIAMSHGRIPLLDQPWMNWVQLLLATPVVFYSGWPFYRGAWLAFRHRRRT
jgi:P-type Cu+ transporter